ncbi:hypothetical protein CF319_g1954 [Tilletia indica]|uniref:S-adenosyl-L-methionine-dependent methyltransferase n=2 Tax=Tilletia TaxID=13289 RepID=A0A8X7N8M6_9BASI|nr:hypothetical protein CF327_g596 [Tilletia walkeri]KAE8225285.1 hypothetical protein CF319_g1954 [Tilletia indica]KAE8234727.1 hypothetical protein CF326_g227 [Tilletia indica]KAE8259119.1 hypothetical protein A4X13_0g1226 [Tilletia indica]KAE8268358.1 hypothetical protein A4X09_0g3979 [Tilletia walkeri]
MNQVYELLDRGYFPDFILRPIIRHLNNLRIRSLEHGSHAENFAYKQRFIEGLKNSEIAIETDKANEQHYEVETDFILTTLGPRAKYSCCLYETGKETLEEAENAMLESYCQKAGLSNTQTILDLGCGWGSLCLFLAAKYPGSKIKALSNSRTQKLYIDGVAKERGLGNLEVFTGDVRTYEFPEGTFDRVLSIEMFEHMKNYALLFDKVARWLKPISAAPSPEDPSKLFIHIFCHKTTPYHFEEDDGWMAKNFFSGGTMPSHDLFAYFQQNVVLEQMWWLNGRHYAQTLEAWLSKQRKENVGGRSIKALRADAKKKGVDEMEGEKTYYRFALFYLACAVFFGQNGGEEWGVGHYLFSKRD